MTTRSGNAPSPVYAWRTAPRSEDRYCRAVLAAKAERPVSASKAVSSANN
jgi:hypothetical protein